METNKKLPVKKINALRQRKALDPARLTGANHPSTAFVMMGHGFEDTTNKQVVPEGCIIVVQVHSGEVNYHPKNFYTNIFNDPEKDKYLDPIANYKYIVDKINSVRGYYTPLAIYREGDEYPEFKYALLSHWDGDASGFVKWDSIELRESGVGQYPFVEAPEFEKLVKRDIPAKEIFLDLYNKSIYPPRAELEQAIDTITEPKTLENIISSPQIQEKIRIPQSELFKKLGKGVYYNLICRVTKDFRSMSLTDPNSGRVIIKNNQRSLVNLSGHIRTNRPEILQGIIEAEAHRKGFIDQLNKNRATNTPPEKTFNINDIVDRIQTLSNLDFSENIEMNMIMYNYLNKKYYPMLKEYYSNKLSQTQNPTDIKKYKGLLSRLERFKPKPVKERVKNEEHELLLQKQMAEQRGAHARALNRAAQNETDFQTAALYMGRNKAAVPVQLVENNKNGFKQRQALAEQQAQEAVGKWTRKVLTGGKTTRKNKKKLRNQKSPNFFLRSAGRWQKSRVRHRI